MLRAGWIAVGISAIFFAALFAGSWLKMIQFGPCGPDLVGYLLLFGIALSLAGGVGLVLVGLIQNGIRKLRMRIGGHETA